MPLTSAPAILAVSLLILTLLTESFSRLRGALPLPVQQPSVGWLAIGGTIASVKFVDALDAVLGIDRMCEFYDLSLSTLNVSHIDDSLCIDSTDFTFSKHGNSLITSITNLAEKGVTHVLCSCGTDKMDLIGSFLSYFAPAHLSIVMTGSMQAADVPGGDGRENIIFANTILQHLSEPLVLAAFNGKCFHACDLVKLDAQNIDGITCDAAARIFPCPTDPTRSIPRALAANCRDFMPRDPPPFDDLWATTLKFVIDASSNPEFIPEAMANLGCDALVLQSRGDCNLPTDDDDLNRAIDDSYVNDRLIVTYSVVIFTQVVPPAYIGGQSYPNVQLGHRTAATTDARIQYVVARGRHKHWTLKERNQNWARAQPGDLILGPSNSIRGD